LDARRALPGKRRHEWRRCRQGCPRHAYSADGGCGIDAQRPQGRQQTAGRDGGAFDALGLALPGDVDRQSVPMRRHVFEGRAHLLIVGQVDNLRADCQSAQPGNARPHRGQLQRVSAHTHYL